MVEKKSVQKQFCGTPPFRCCEVLQLALRIFRTHSPFHIDQNAECVSFFFKRAWLHRARPFLPAQPLRGPLSVQAVYAMPRPKSHFRQGRFRHLLRPQAPAMHQSVPDVDNLLKFSLDAMNTYFYGDDKQIVSVLARKTYAEAPNNQPYTEIRLEEVPPL